MSNHGRSTPYLPSTQAAMVTGGRHRAVGGAGRRGDRLAGPDRGDRCRRGWAGWRGRPGSGRPAGRAGRERTAERLGRARKAMGVLGQRSRQGAGAVAQAAARVAQARQRLAQAVAAQQAKLYCSRQRKYQRVPSLSGLLPPHRTPLRLGCPQLHRPAATGRWQGSFTPTRSNGGVSWRTSTLFHFEVPGGKWQTVIASPVWAARVASSLFHARVR